MGMSERQATRGSIPRLNKKVSGKAPAGQVACGTLTSKKLLLLARHSRLPQRCCQAGVRRHTNLLVWHSPATTSTPTTNSSQHENRKTTGCQQVTAKMTPGDFSGEGSTCQAPRPSSLIAAMISGNGNPGPLGRWLCWNQARSQVSSWVPSKTEGSFHQRLFLLVLLVLSTMRQGRRRSGADL